MISLIPLRLWQNGLDTDDVEDEENWQVREISDLHLYFCSIVFVFSLYCIWICISHSAVCTTEPGP